MVPAPGSAGSGAYPRATASARRTGMRAKLDGTFRVRFGGTGTLKQESTVSIADLREDIATGQWVAAYWLEGSLDGKTWQVLSKGTTIGYRKLDRFPPTSVRHIRLTATDTAGQPRRVSLGLYA